MSVPSASFKKVDDYYGVDGGVSAANIEHLKENYNSGGVLYLCGDDSGYVCASATNVYVILFACLTVEILKILKSMLVLQC